MGPMRSAQLSEWFDALAPALVLYARQWVDAAPAEDVVQDVFARLMCRREAPGSPKGWLFRCVRNAAISRLRSESRRRRHHERLAAGGAAMFRPDPAAAIDAAAAEEALNELPLELREVVVLRIWGQMKLREIAETTGRPVSTVMSRYQSALEKIRQRMVKPCKTKQT